MKKVINGKRYDTDTAKEAAVWQSMADAGDLGYCEESLRIKRSGEFFVHGSGGAASKYAKSLGGGRFGGGEDIIPLTEAEARSWAEDRLDGEGYKRLFGEVGEDGGKVAKTFSLPSAVAERIERGARERGISQSAMVEELAEALR